MQGNTQGFRSLVGRFSRPGLLILTVTLASSIMAFAEDVIVLKNGDRISGKVKKLEAGDVHIVLCRGDLGRGPLEWIHSNGP